MRSTKDEIRFPNPIRDRGKERAGEEGYESWPRYVVGCVLRDILMRERHFLVRAVANAKWTEQDRLIDAILTISPALLARVTVEALLNGDHLRLQKKLA